MLTAESRVKILDFGLAKSIILDFGLAKFISRAPASPDETRTIGLTDPGAILGTVSYMSPEQASCRADVDGRSDQFSLGLIVHELISGKKAFEAETMAAVLREDPAPLPESL